MKNDNCIFCKIASGEIPSRKIYEDDVFVVILDLNPTSKGHALIIPKLHYKDLYELDTEIAGRIMKLAKKMAVKMTKVLGCDGFNLLQNNGECAGQTMFHFHMHLIPRYKNDNNGEMLQFVSANISDEELDHICEQIKKA